MFRTSSILMILVAVLLMTSVAYGADPTLGGTPVTIGGIESLIKSIAQWLLNISVIVVVIYIVYGGIMMVMSSGNATKFTEGKKIIINALIGGAVIFGVGVIVSTIANFAQDPTTIGGGGPPVKYAREGVSS